jgi:hypothetical protein
VGREKQKREEASGSEEEEFTQRAQSEEKKVFGFWS